MTLKFPLPGFLDPALKFSWSFSRTAFEYFPEVTHCDLVNDQERYRLLLGNWEINGTSVHIIVESVMEIDDEPDCYVEQAGQCTVNMLQCRIAAQRVIRHVKRPDLHLVGDLHTHPSIRGMPWRYSPDDRDAWFTWYEDNTLTPYTPFLFVIGGRIDGLRTGYAGYRVLKQSEKVWGIDRVIENGFAEDR